jgi:hypothetical protein
VACKEEFVPNYGQGPLIEDCPEEYLEIVQRALKGIPVEEFNPLTYSCGFASVVQVRLFLFSKDRGGQDS